MLVTALEASEKVPSMDVVTERLLHEERKHKGREEGANLPDKKAMVTPLRRVNKRGSCYHCGRHGHFKRDCPELLSERSKRDERHTAHKVTEETSDGDDALIIEQEALSVSLMDQWIVDSGATSHMCNCRLLFVEYRSLNEPEKVTLGDGYSLNAIGRGMVELVMRLPEGKRKKCKLQNTLFVPDLAYNLLSVSKVSG